MTIYPTRSTDSRNVSRQDRSPLLQTIASRRSGEHPLGTFFSQTSRRARTGWSAAGLGAENRRGGRESGGKAHLLVSIHRFRFAHLEEVAILALRRLPLRLSPGSAPGGRPESGDRRLAHG